MQNGITVSHIHHVICYGIVCQHRVRNEIDVLVRHRFNVALIAILVILLLHILLRPSSLSHDVCDTPYDEQCKYNKYQFLHIWVACYIECTVFFSISLQTLLAVFSMLPNTNVRYPSRSGSSLMNRK